MNKIDEPGQENWCGHLSRVRRAIAPKGRETTEPVGSQFHSTLVRGYSMGSPFWILSSRCPCPSDRSRPSKTSITWLRFGQCFPLLSVRHPIGCKSAFGSVSLDGKLLSNSLQSHTLLHPRDHINTKFLFQLFCNFDCPKKKGHETGFLLVSLSATMHARNESTTPAGESSKG